MLAIQNWAMHGSFKRSKNIIYSDSSLNFITEILQKGSGNSPQQIRVSCSQTE